MLDVLLGLAVEGLKSFAQSETGRTAIHVAVHQGGHAIMHALEDSKSNIGSRASVGSSVAASVEAGPRKRPDGLPRIMKCPHCGRDVCTDYPTCWNCDGKIW